MYIGVTWVVSLLDDPIKDNGNKLTESCSCSVSYRTFRVRMKLETYHYRLRYGTIILTGLPCHHGHGDVTMVMLPCKLTIVLFRCTIV